MNYEPKEPKQSGQNQRELNAIYDKIGDAKKAVLLYELKESQGILPNGRKSRSDKGQKRNHYNSKTMNSQSHNQIYLRVKSRLYGQGQDILNLLDVNALFVEIPEKFRIEHGEFTKVVKGKTIVNTVKYVRTSRKVDLEEYRFKALMEKALESPDAYPGTTFDLIVMLQTRYGFTRQDAVNSILSNVSYTWLDFFKELYHLGDDYEQWTYDLWRSHYDRCPKECLPEDFVFDYNNLPGSQGFHSDWAYKVKERQDEEEQEELEKKERRAWTSRVNGNRRSK